MTIERQLLENVLDAMDRLFDRHISAIDLWGLLLATAEALRATPHYGALLSPTAQLLAISRSGTDTETERDQALDATDVLRHYLAELLPFG